MSKRYLAVAALLCALARAVGAQNLTTQGNITSGSATCGSSNCVYYQLPPSVPYVVVTISGAWAGSINFQSISAPNANYANLNSVSWTLVATETGNGTWSVATGGATFLLAQAPTLSSGKAQVSMAASQTGSPLSNPVFPGNVTAQDLTILGATPGSYAKADGSGYGTPAGGGSPTGAAGGDLKGTYPNPGVGQMNGAAVPASQPCLASNGSSQLIAGTGCAPYITVLPSGDATGGTDCGNIQTACAASHSVRLAPGIYYGGKSNAVCTFSTACDVIATGPGQTYWQNEGTTNDLWDITYASTTGASPIQGMTVRGVQFIQDSAVTATGGYAILIGTGSGSTYTQNLRIEDINIQKTCNGIHFQTGQILNSVDAVINNETCNYGVYYDTALPGGDDLIDVQMAGVNTCMAINQSDTTTFLDAKLNGCGLSFLQGGTTNSVRFVNLSVEGTGSGTAIDFGAGTGTNAPQNIIFSGGETALFTTSFGHPANAQWSACPFINRDNDAYLYGGQLMCHSPSLSGGSPTCTSYNSLVLYDNTCASAAQSAFQARDSFVGSGAITSHTANTGQTWVDWAAAGDCAAATYMNLLSTSAGVSNVCTTGNTTAYLNFTPTTADYSTCATLTSNAATAGVWDRMTAAGTATGNELIYIAGTGIQLYQVVAGVPTQIGSTHAYTWSGVHTLCITSAGTALTSFFDGVALSGVSGTTAVIANGFAGLRLGASGKAPAYEFTVQ